MRSAVLRAGHGLLRRSHVRTDPLATCQPPLLPRTCEPHVAKIFPLSGSPSELGEVTSRGLVLLTSRDVVLPRGGAELAVPRGPHVRNFFGVGEGEEESGVARRHEERRVLGYSPEQLFDVVAGVDLYEDFVPWCRRSSVLCRRDGQMDAELEIGFRLFCEKYISHVRMERPRYVKTSVSQSLLFDYLDNLWEFSPGPVPHSTNLHFHVAFQFRSALYRGVADLFFDEVVARLVSAFENRCRTVYGPSKAIYRKTEQRETLHRT